MQVEKVINSYRVGLLDFFRFVNNNDSCIKCEKRFNEIQNDVINNYNNLLELFNNKINHTSNNIFSYQQLIIREEA